MNVDEALDWTDNGASPDAIHAAIDRFLVFIDDGKTCPCWKEEQI